MWSKEEKDFEFKDKKRREIVLKLENETTITAYHSNNKIGEFQYRVIEYPYKYTEYESYKLSSMNIDKEYQKSGIGTKMIEYGEQIFKNTEYIKAFDTHDDGNDEYYLSEGLALIDHCIEKGIISKSKVYEEYEEDEY